MNSVSLRAVWNVQYWCSLLIQEKLNDVASNRFISLHLFSMETFSSFAQLSVIFNLQSKRKVILSVQWDELFYVDWKLLRIFPFFALRASDFFGRKSFMRCFWCWTENFVSSTTRFETFFADWFRTGKLAGSIARRVTMILRLKIIFLQFSNELWNVWQKKLGKLLVSSLKFRRPGNPPPPPKAFAFRLFGYHYIRSSEM